MRKYRSTLLLALLLLAVSALSLFVGVIALSPSELLRGGEQAEILLISRLPRLLAILCTGAGMSVAGLIMQQLCRNKFVSPTTGATISSAQFGILLALVYMPQSTIWSRAVFSAVCAVLGTWVFVCFVQYIPFRDPVMVPLVGIMFGNVIGGITNYIAYRYEMTQALSSWLTGSFSTALHLRSVKVIVMLLAAAAIGAASIVFQSIINNTIVTPCLLGMNALYTLVHTAVAFFLGTGSILLRSGNAAFAMDLLIMSVTATFLYGFIFKKTKYNVLYVLLIGTVLSSFFSSIQSTQVRVMDPNEYETLLVTLVASFSNVNEEIILFAALLMAAIAFVLRRDLGVLDVITLGREQAINLGVDYDRVIRRLLLGVVLYISVATALVGPISFLGLIIANLSRQLFRTYRHTRLIAGSVLIGMVLLVAGQLIVEQVYTYAIPISVFITVGGGVYFLYLLLMQRKRG